MSTQPQDAPWASFDSLQDEEQSLDIWGFLQRRKAFVILLALVGAGLGYMYFQRQIPQFSSSALLQVIHHGGEPLVESQLAEQNLSGAQFVVTSRKLLLPCFQENDLSKLETFQGMATDDAVQRMADMLSAESEVSDILLLSCVGPVPEDTSKIANAVSQAFLTHHKKNYETAVTNLQQLLSSATGELSDSVTQLENDYEEFDKASPLMSDGANIHRGRLTQINETISTLMIRQTELKAEILGLEEAMRTGGQRDALLFLVGKQAEGELNDKSEEVSNPDTDAGAGGNAETETMFETLFPLLMEEAILADQVGPGHPKLVALRKRIELTRDHFDALAGMAPKKKKKDEKVEPRPDFLVVYLESLRQELSLYEKKNLDLQALANIEEAEAKKLRNFEHTRTKFQRRIARESSLLDDVQEQMRKTEIPTSVGGVTAQVLTEARHGELVYPVISRFLGLGAFLGGFAGLALGYLVEMADRSFRKPEEIIREFGIPIIGHIPYMQEQKLRKIPKDVTMDRSIISLHLPRSRPAEAYRSVRTAVCFSAVGSKHRLIQITSPAAGDGKSTLAMNFAVSMAQSGNKTIIVESDFRRPRVHKLTGVDSRVGIVDVLRGDAELVDAIKETEVDNFYVLPCGSRPRDPSELLSRPEYEQVLQVLKEKFDYVIVDTPPVLVVTDPCSVGPRVDGVLLCVRLSRHTRDFGRRALEQLRDVGANMTGIVVNGVEETDAYGYGNYSYSDYRYRYKDYDYGYEGKSDDVYFAESEEAPPSLK